MVKIEMDLSAGDAFFVDAADEFLVRVSFPDTTDGRLVARSRRPGELDAESRHVLDAKSTEERFN